MPHLPRTVTEPLLTAGTAGFRLASRVRGERAVHAAGVTLTGRLHVTGTDTGAPLLDEASSYDVLVRLSRAIGTPRSVPDVFGLAVRILDAHGEGRHQDLLLDTSRPAPGLRHVPFPATGAHGLLSSLLPYEIAGTTCLLGARGEQPEWELLVATLTGPWRAWGTVRTAGELPAPRGRQVRFNPWTTGDGIEPTGPLQEWRRRAYPASHVAPDEV